MELSAPAVIESIDWGRTPLGPRDRWPQSLRTALSICLGSRFPMAIWWGPSGIQLYNDGYRMILGRKHPHSMGQVGWECWAEIWDVVGPLYDQVMQQGEPIWSEDLLLLMERYGYEEETYFTFSYSPVRDESGEVGGVLITCVETTERVLGERRLNTLKDIGASATQSVEHAFALSAETLAQNPLDLPFALLYRVDQAEGDIRLAATSGIDANHPAVPAGLGMESADPDAWGLREVARTGRAVLVEGLPTRFGALPSGGWPDPPTAALSLPVLLPGHDLPTAILVAAVSPRRALDESYRAFFELLAGRIAATVAETLAYEEERQRAESLAELDRAKTAFFSNVSHEFRTPLTLVLGTLEQALSTDGTSTAEGLAVAYRNGQRLLRLVNTLLDFSRIEAGRAEAVYEPIDLGSATAELASAFRSAVESAGMQLSIDCPSSAERVYVDRDMWEKIVLNLISNAFKFTLEGEIAVSLAPEDGHAVLRVRDTGIGIPADEIPKLFTRFHRIEGARGRTYEGSGIGLALVQELVQLHGGSVSVTSEVGAGSTFEVRVPLGAAHLPADRIGTSRELVSTALGAQPFVEEALRWLPDGVDESTRAARTAFDTAPLLTPLDEDARRSVLIADDNADMRDYLRRLLSTRYEVTTVADGAAALREIEQQPPDLVLADVMMPRLDGFELLATIRSNELLRAIPVILLSARAGEEARIEGMQAGADDYLTKPFSARELIARVEAHVRLADERSRAEQVLREKEAQLAADLANAELLRNISAQLIEGDHVDRLYERILEGAMAVMHSHCAAVQMLEPDSDGGGGMLRLLAHRGLTEEDADFWHWVTATSPSACGEALRTRRRVIVSDVAASESMAGSEEQSRYLAAGVQAIQTTPLLSRSGQLIGALSTHWSHPHTPPERDLRLLDVLARQAADLIERRISDEALSAARADAVAREQRERERLQRAVEQAPAALCLLTGPDHVFTLASPKYLELVGHRPLIGRPVHEALPEVARQGYLELLDHVYQSGEPFVGTESVIEFDDERGDSSSRHYVNFVYAPTRDRDGNVDGIFVHLYEVTEQVEARLAAEAARSDAERAQADLEDAVRAREEFLSIASHELRNPVAAMTGTAQLLRRAHKSGRLTQERLATYIEALEESGARLANLTNDLLDVSRLQRGMLPLRPQEVNLADLVRDLARRGEWPTQRLVVEVQEQETTGIVDPDRIRQVIANLLDNAVKYSPSHTDVRVKMWSDGSGTLLEVRDSGIGLPPQSLETIFTPFGRAPNAAAANIPGLGLGLYVARRIAEQHGGRLWAHSEGDGKGTTMSLWLPRPESAPWSPESAAATETAQHA